MKAEIRLETALLAVESENRVHALLTLQAPAVPERERPPLHLALVIDRSGSMDGEKLDVAIRCARYLVEHLLATDTLALIDFDDTVRLLAPAAPVNKGTLLAALSRIISGGTTNLSGGWLKGREELLRVAGEGARRILLLTDGRANVGITDAPQLAGLAETTRGEGITTTTIGFGSGFDETLLTAMAQAGGGRGYFAESPDEAPGIFAEEFEGLATLFAQNLSVEIRPEPGAVGLEILNDYPAVGVEGGVQVQIGDVLANEERRLLFRLAVPGLEDLGPRKIAGLVIRYVTVGEKVEARELTIPVHVNVVSAEEAAKAGLDSKVKEEVAVLAAARARRVARRQADEGLHEQATRTLEQAASELEEILPGTDRRDEIQDDIAELRHTARRIRESGWDTLDAKRLHYEAYSRGTSRDPRSTRRRGSPEDQTPDQETDPDTGDDEGPR